jgi:hypothetical protein
MIKALADPDQLVSTLMLYVIQNFEEGRGTDSHAFFDFSAPGKPGTERA